MARAKKGDKKIILRVVLILGLLLFATALLKLYQDLLSANVRQDAGNEILYVYSNTGFDENFERIKKQDLLKHTEALKRLISFSGYDLMVKPGRYRLKKGMNNLELMRMLVSGKQEPVDVVFKYAARKHDIAVFWSKQLEADSNSIEQLLNGPLITDALGLSTDEVVMAFIPNTYNFYWNTSALQFTNRMMGEFRKFWDSTRREKAASLGMSVAETGTLASIVQKETYRTDEMPVVAGVYYNRLKKGMPLQADPTLIYAMNNDQIRRVGGEMLKVESPYNTYINKGLPPGPICVPSIQAIEAVLNLQHHSYIYFCAKEDFSGYHRFATTFAQHQVNARKYQQALNRKGIQ